YVNIEMSIPKKGSRKIIVGENEFLWLIRSKLTYSQDCLGTEMTAVTNLDYAQYSCGLCCKNREA
ncbi:hypothetical protein, partial [Klebsiella pneumoniae]|uniref:hypothetical protein n=1 Tax=Klebsiella pneumoniae TaxID=573 RepID=UPI001C385A5A